MFNLKRLAKYTLASGLALGLVFSTGVRAMAAEEVDAAKEVITYDMDYHHNVLRITVLKEEDVPVAAKKDDLFAHGEPKYVYVGVGKTDAAIKAYDRFEVKCEVTDDSKPADGDTPAVAATKYSYDYYVEVDLPTYVSPTVKYIVKAYSSNQVVADAKTYTIATQTRKLEVKYAPKDAALTVKADGTDLKAADGTYEIKTLYGDWIDSTKVGAEKYESYAVYGATLVVREKATTEKPASKEVKVKIPKKANGPKATINPTKLTVTIPKNTVWRIVGNTPRSDAKANADDKYIWTATDTDNEGWIKNSEGKARALTELQKKITEAGATIETLKLNPKYNPAEQDTTKDTFGKYLDANDKGTDDPTKAAKENTPIALFDEGAVLELKTEATDKKAESKVSFFEIPVQSEAVKLGTDFKVSYTLSNDRSKVTKMDVKNESSGTLEVALADSGYDLTKVTFAKLAPGATKSYGATAAKENKILLVRTASVVANARNNVEMVLGGEVAEYVVAYPKKAEALSGVTLTKDTDATVAGKAILAVGSPDETKAYAYKIDTEEASAEGLAPALPTGTTPIPADPDNKSVTIPVSGLEADKYITVYEYDDATKIVSKMVSHKIAAGEISQDPTPPTPPTE